MCPVATVLFSFQTTSFDVGQNDYEKFFDVLKWIQSYSDILGGILVFGDVSFVFNFGFIVLVLVLVLLVAASSISAPEVWWN